MPDALHESNHDDASDSRASEAFVFPASFAQRRLWFVDQLDPGHALYNAPAAFRAKGPVVHAALEAAVNQIVARHESLRTTFRLIDGEPSQIIAPELRLRVPVVDLRSLPHGTREGELAKFIGREAGQPFDLAAGPLLRVTLVQLGEDESALVLVFHHIVTDMWSQEIFMRELVALYESFRTAQPCPLPALPIQYADFAQWQRGQFQGGASDRELAYWKQKLDGLAPSELPLTHARPAAPSHHGRTLGFEIDAALTASLKRLAQDGGVSLFMLMLAAWKTLLYRYTSQTDVSVGSPISNRHSAETEPLIGFFLNTLLLRTDLAGNPPFRALLGRVRETVLGAFANDSLPFDVLVEKLHPSRAAGRNPLFNVAFVLVHDGGRPLSLPGLVFTPLPIEQTNAKFDLTVMLNEAEAKVTGSIEFSTEVFDEPCIARMAEHFQTLLKGIASAPDTPIGLLPLLGPEEREWLVAGLNRTARPFPSQKTVAALFEEQVARTPGRIAVECGDEAVTYADLNRRANRVARHLRALGAGRGVRVGVCMERSLELIVSILAIVKAGGAYVPLDAASPPERLASMLNESGSGIVLTRTGGAEIPADSKAGAVIFDTVDFSGYDAANLPIDGGGDDLAYVIFTSGSTGKPKGVAVPNRAIARLVIHADYARITTGDFVAHMSNTGFDAATFEIWGALLNGATLVIASRDIVLSTADFSNFLADRKITTLFLTTALFNQIALQNPASFRSLNTLLFGGEASDPGCVRRVLEHGAPGRLVHVYGPTEATTFASWHPVREVPADAVTVPIGLPITNTEIHILDSHFQPVPCGVTGEIFIGGPGLAAGYLNDAGLTSRRFLETPFGRLYKTGDLGRRRADGAIEFCGRSDSQLKLRGYRIEPGEIETALRQNSLIRQASVVARTEAGVAQSLTGYLVPQSDARLKTADLRQFLSRRLPDYMIPSAFVWLDALPLTPNGKLDIARLPPPGPAEDSGSTAPVLPRNAIEQGIAGIWKHVLGRDAKSVTEDFFTSGGHSLLALRLLDRIREEFGVAIPARHLFEMPTIEGLAMYVTGKKSAEAPSEGALDSTRRPELKAVASPLAPVVGKVENLVPIQRGSPGHLPFFLVPGGLGGDEEFLVYASLVRHTDLSLPLYGLRARASSFDELPGKSAAEFAEDFVREIKAVQPEGPYLLGGECVGGMVAYEMARQLEAQGQEISLLLLLGTAWPAEGDLQLFNEWEINYRRQECDKMRRTLRQHWAEARKHSPVGILRYAWHQMWPGTLDRKIAAFVAERECRTAWPRRLFIHTPKPYSGRVTLLQDEVSSRGSMVARWRQHHPGEIDVHVVEGDHLSYIRENARGTAVKLREIFEHAMHPTPC